MIDNFKNQNTQLCLPISSTLRKFPFWPVNFGGRFWSSEDICSMTELLEDGNEIG